MIIKHLEIENWKCFSSKKSFDFNKHELINMKNGSGKTSIFEAILYAIWGKAPIGFNLNTVRYDPEKPCRVFITFDLKDGMQIKEASIERIFGNSAPLSELKIDGVVVCESVRTIEEYMDKIINKKITTQLWTSSLINSDITSSNFFTNSILEDILKDPLELVGAYKSKIYSHNRQINSFNEKILDANQIIQNIEDIKSKLKEKSNGDINLARSSENAAKQIKLLQEKIGNSSISIDEAREYMKLYRFKNKIKAELKCELNKKESALSFFNQTELKKIAHYSKKHGKCVLCNNDFDENHENELLKEMLLSGRSEEKINVLQKQLKLLEYDQAIVSSILELESQKSILNKCKDYQKIIDNYNEENDKLWKEFEIHNKNLAIALKQQEKLKEINQLKADVIGFKEKLNVLNHYIEEASAYYTNKIMEKATQYLNSINSRYKQIALYENAFHVIVENSSDFSLNLLPITRLSSGEKTMCALSLLFAIHNIIVPELPLLFDETFAALDIENLEQIQRFLSKQDTQIFIITHDKNWSEF